MIETEFDSPVLNFSDEEWPLDYIDHDRHIVRAVVFDGENNLYFVRADRDDIFGSRTGVEPNSLSSMNFSVF